MTGTIIHHTRTHHTHTQTCTHTHLVVTTCWAVPVPGQPSATTLRTGRAGSTVEAATATATATAVAPATTVATTATATTVATTATATTVATTTLGRSNTLRLGGAALAAGRVASELHKHHKQRHWRSRYQQDHWAPSKTSGPTTLIQRSMYSVGFGGQGWSYRLNGWGGGRVWRSESAVCLKGRCRSDRTDLVIAARGAQPVTRTQGATTSGGATEATVRGGSIASSVTTGAGRGALAAHLVAGKLWARGNPQVGMPSRGPTAHTHALT
jgi:hypothetical protein